jgi:uncharacterized membrane protein YozB (DUF420 family)
MGTKPGMSSALSSKSHRGNWYVQLIISLLIFFCAFALISFRIDQAPDIFTDEIIYSRVGVRIAGEGALVWDSGEPFIVHPPLYFLFVGFFQSFTGEANQVLYSPGDIFSTVFHIRLLNSFFGALTCVILYWFGKRLHSDSLGFLVAALFMLDPFALRINRRAMLETQAMLLALVGLYIFYNNIKSNSSLKKPSILAVGPLLAGLFFGAAFLTKELTFVFLIPLIFFSLWEFMLQKPWIFFARKAKPVHAASSPRWASILWLPVYTISTLATALLTYSLYPIWIYLTGNSEVYMNEKLLGLMRLLGLVQITGWNRSGISLLDILLERLTRYGTSYFILAVGGLALVYILIWGRDKSSGRFLASLGLILYPFFAFVALFGSGNDQFFYFLLIPAILIFGYALNLLVFIYSDYRHRQKIHMFLDRFTSAIIPGIVSIFLLTNTALWLAGYGKGNDNGYTQFANFVEASLPANAVINASGDPIKFRYFLPGHTIYAAATPDEAISRGIQYFALAPKDVLMRYGRIQPELAEWIVAQGTLLFSATGSSYGDINLYQVRNDSSIKEALTQQSSHQLQGSQFKAAQGGFISSLIILLLLWLLILVILSSAIYLSANPARHTEKNINNAHRI